MKKLTRTTASLPQTRPVKVLQFGGGNFLRGFIDWVVDILNEKTEFNGAIQIIQSISAGVGSPINTQEGLYHVVLNGIRHGKSFYETRLIASVKGAINPLEDVAAYLKMAENSELRFIVSNTTEAGITFSALDTDQESLSTTFPGKLTMFLYHRFQFFGGAAEKGLVMLPCELIEKNGEALMNSVLQYSSLWNLPRGFHEWIKHHNSFCNTLVDRIVPGFPKEKIDQIEQSIGYEDNLIVAAEPYHLWMIEAPEAVQQEFPVDQIGLNIKFVKDLTPYRTRKVRILNGAHTSLVPVAYLSGFRTVRESMEDPSISHYLHNTLFEEIIPTLDLPSEELRQFANDVIERFLNPSIRHELISISLNSISKYKIRVLPSVLKFIEIENQLPDRLLFSLAALIRFYKGQWLNEVIPINDTPAVIDFFKKAWKEYPVEEIVRATLANVSFWGQDLTKIDGFVEKVTGYLMHIESEKGFAIPEFG